MPSAAPAKDEPRFRVFLAVVPPPDIRLQISKVQNRLQQQWRSAVRWVNPRYVHLTLKFFGKISANEISAVRSVVRKLCAHRAPFSLTACRLGAFPNAKMPRVIWLGLQGDLASLLRLQRDIDEELADCGFAIEQRPFHPHLTVARLKRPQALAQLAEMVAGSDGFTADRFSVRELTLMKSELTPRGPVYTELARFPLRRVGVL